MADGRDLGAGAGPPGDAHLGDAVVELVLGDVDADPRATMVAHVVRCATCRREYDALAATVERLLPGVPAVEPPIGFDERVLARLVADGRSAGRGSPRRWRVLAAAAAVVVAVLVPVGVWVTTRGDDATTAGDVALLRLTRDDSPVGTVSLSEIDGDALMVVALVGAPADVAYYCRARFTDGTTVDSSSWSAGNGAWVVPLPSTTDVAAVDVLPAGTDKVWSSATFT